MNQTLVDLGPEHTYLYDLIKEMELLAFLTLILVEYFHLRTTLLILSKNLRFLWNNPLYLHRYVLIKWSISVISMFVCFLCSKLMDFTQKNCSTNIFPLILQLPCQPVDNNDYNNDNDDYVDNKKYPLVSPLPIELRGSLPILS